MEDHSMFVWLAFGASALVFAAVGAAEAGLHGTAKVGGYLALVWMVFSLMYYGPIERRIRWLEERWGDEA